MTLIPFTIVRQNSAKIIERWGKFNRILKPGFRFVIPLADKVVKVVDYNITKEVDFEMRVKSADDSFSTVLGTIHRVIPDDDKQIYNSYYSLAKPEKQMIDYVEDFISTSCSTVNLKDLYTHKSVMSAKIKEGLSKIMTQHGFEIRNALIRDIRPDEKIVGAMNEINASQRTLEAERNKAEAEKVNIVTRAEAEAKKMELMGQGLAKQRAAIMSGYKEMVENFNGMDVGPAETIKLLLTSQHIDAWKELATSPNAKVIISADDIGGSYKSSPPLPHSPSPRSPTPSYSSTVPKSNNQQPTTITSATMSDLKRALITAQHT